MLSYDEIVNINKQYRYKVDLQTGEKKLVNRQDDSLEVSEENDLKYRSAIYLYSCAESLANEFSGLYASTAPWSNEEEKLEWKKGKVLEMQKFVSSVADKGEYNLKLNLGSAIAQCDYRFFGDLRIDDKLSTVASGARSLLEYTLEQKGKKLEDISIESRPDLSTHYSWTAREKSFQERLKPSDSSYTQEDKPKSLSPEGQAKRRQFTEKLIKAYVMAETDSMYDKRVEKEDNNMRYVANTINGSRTIPEVKQDLPRLMRLLIAAQNISLDGETDYLEEIISQPAVSHALSELRRDGQLDKLRTIGEKKEQEGKVSGGRTHSETKGETHRRIANRVIKEDPDAVSKARAALAKRNNGLVADERKAMLFSVVARTQGKIPTYERDETSGKYSFNAGESLTKNSYDESTR